MILSHENAPSSERFLAREVQITWLAADFGHPFLRPKTPSTEASEQLNQREKSARRLPRSSKLTLKNPNYE
jgi:hypothetical protein